MDSYDQLAIRACKRLYGPVLLKRLRKIYARRVAVSEPGVDNECLFVWLVSVAEKFDKKVDFVGLIIDARPDSAWKFAAGAWTDYWERFIFVLASRIRMMEVKYIPGYRIPSYFIRLVNASQPS